MSTIVTRAGKGSALTHVEVDANFTNLNTDKIQSGNTVASLTITSATINGGTITGITDLAVADGGTGLSTLTAGYIPFGAGTSAFGSSANFFWDNTNSRLGIGTASPTSKLTVTQGTAGATSVVFNGVASRYNFGFSGLGDSYFDQAAIYFRKFDATDCGSLATGTNTVLNLVSSTGYSLLTLNTASGNTSYLDFTANSVATSRISSNTGNGMVFSTGSSNTERMRIDSSGNVGIGVTSTSGFKFAVGGVGLKNQFINTDAANTYLYSDGNAYFGATGSFFNAFITNNTERMRIDSSGNVGIGTSSPQSKLDVSSATNEGIRFTDGTRVTKLFNSSGISAGALWVTSNDALSLGTNNTERMRIDTSGNVLVGTTSVLSAGATSGTGTSIGTAATIVQNLNTANAMYYKTKTGGGTTNQYFDSFFVGATNVGWIISSSGTTLTYASASDYRLKENVIPMVNALDTISKLKPVTYKWKQNGSDGQGFIAHELQEVMPDCVTGEKDAVDADGKPVYQGVDTSFLVATLTAAIQEQQTIINDLKARITTLEGK